ncbi:MAG TPA: hypothetical protein VG034_25305 [Acidimicrobiia bacterium]|nr:hypothetical protein [Acidimicrobiia bacterium]
MSPTVLGLHVAVVYSVNSQMLVTNRGPQTVTFLADSGEPFLEIGPAGVRGNVASPTFYDSNAPEGLAKFPQQAKPGSDVPPIWRRSPLSRAGAGSTTGFTPPNITSRPRSARRANRPCSAGGRSPSGLRGTSVELARVPGGGAPHRPAPGGH